MRFRRPLCINYLVDAVCRSSSSQDSDSDHPAIVVQEVASDPTKNRNPNYQPSGPSVRCGSSIVYVQDDAGLSIVTDLVNQVVAKGYSFAALGQVAKEDPPMTLQGQKKQDTKFTTHWDTINDNLSRINLVDSSRRTAKRNAAQQRDRVEKLERELDDLPEEAELKEAQKKTCH